MVNKVKQVLKDHFHSAAAMQVMELEVGQKYMVIKAYGSTLNINLNQQWTPPTTQTEHQQRHMPIPPDPARLKTNVLTIQEKTCSCGRWQEYKYPGRHAISYFKKWEDMSFPDILQKHVHDYYRNKSMHHIYGYSIFPVVQDQIRYNGETNPPKFWGSGNLDNPKLNKSAIISIFLIWMNPQSSALCVEREDIIEGHAQML